MKDNKGPQSIKDILSSFNWNEDKYISQEFQDYGYHLAEQLNDLEHKALSHFLFFGTTVVPAPSPIYFLPLSIFFSINPFTTFPLLHLELMQ